MWDLIVLLETDLEGRRIFAKDPPTCPLDKRPGFTQTHPLTSLINCEVWKSQRNWLIWLVQVEKSFYYITLQGCPTHYCTPYSIGKVGNLEWVEKSNCMQSWNLGLKWHSIRMTFYSRNLLIAETDKTNQTADSVSYKPASTLTGESKFEGFAKKWRDVHKGSNPCSHPHWKLRSIENQYAGASNLTGRIGFRTADQ